MATIYGTSSANTLNGGDAADRIYGYGGNDTINGKSGHDWVYGGDGNDTIYGGDGNDHLFGDAGNDVIWGDYGDDVIYGDDGNDTLYGGGGTNVLYGGEGNDILSSGGSGNWITSTKMYGGTGNDVYSLSRVSDTILVDDAVPQVFENANEGYDTIRLGTSFFNEMTEYTIPANVEALMIDRHPAAWLYSEPDEYARVKGNALDNFIIGSPEDDGINGGDGNDAIYSRDPAKPNAARIDNGWGQDNLNGGNGNDKLYAVGPDRPTMIGGWGNDAFYVDDNGYNGTDIGLFAGWSIVELAGQGDDTLYSKTASTFLPKNVETLVYTGTASSTHLWGNADANTIIGGGNSADEIYGYEGDDTLDGGVGYSHDMLAGGSGQDSLFGRAGDDTLFGEAGNDKLFGGDGNDKMWGGTGDDWMTGENGDDQMVGDDGIDTLFGGDGNDKMWGGAGADNLSGGNGNDILNGGDGNDYLFGGDGNDALFGDAGNDILNGFYGNDTLYSGMGADKLTGGSGADIFMYRYTYDSGSASGKDQITDFQHGVDKIDLSMMDAHAYASGNQAFTYRGTQGFSSGWHPAELTIAYEGGNTIVRGDTDGVGNPDLEIVLLGIIPLDINDFVL
jgi:Ca2+-binding RTX toxin-like protein